MPGLRAGGSAADVTDLQIRNMGGSLSEWIEDTFVDYSDPQCWGPDAGLRINPRCTSGAQSIVRGGSWATDPVLSESATRDTSVTTEPRDTVGFRCAQ